MLLNGNLKFIGSGEIQNLRIENLATDPSSPVNGQLWYNTASLKLKYYDGSAVRILAVGGDTAALQAAIDQLVLDLAAESTTRASADTTLTNNLNAEITARTSADTTLQNNLNAETTARQGADTTLQNNINAEATARADAIIAEASARTAADTTLTNNLATETSNRTAADTTLTNNLNAEITARTDADTTLTNNLAAETTARQGADTTLQNNINAEATTRASADTTLQNNLNAETTARQTADTTLTNNLNTEITARTDADTTLQNNLDTETSARQAADALRVLKAGDSMTGNLAFGGTSKVTGLAAPTQAEDAVNKDYVDSLLSGLSWKVAVDSVGATNPLTATTGQRFLNTTDGKIYTATATDTWGTGVASVDGFAVFDRTDETGYVYSGSAWTQFTGTGQIAAGVGLVKNGNQLDVNLGAGIQQLPSDEVGIDLYSTGGLFLTEDGTTDSGASAAKISVKLNGSTLFKDASGLKIHADVITQINASTSGLSAEITARTDADTTLQNNINAETTARTDADTTLQNNINAEATTRASADTTLTNNLATETTARQTADTTLTNNLNAEITARTDADTTLQNNINAEATARADADTVLQGNINAETTARQAADTTLTNNLNAEITARTSADTTLTNNLNAEITARTAADSAEATTRADADTAITNRLVACFFVYTGGSASTSHVVTHGIGAKFCNVTVVDSSDEVIIPQSIKYDSTTQLTVTFNSAITCKVVVSGLNPGA